MHTPLCHHATGEPVEYAKRALELGLQEIGFSDHSPMPQLSGAFDLTIAAGTPAPVHRVLGPGDHFGERVLFGGDVRIGEVVALEDSEVLFMERDDFLRFAGGFKFLEDYFREYLTANFPQHVLPESVQTPKTEQNV